MRACLLYDLPSTARVIRTGHTVFRFAVFLFANFSMHSSAIFSDGCLCVVSRGSLSFLLLLPKNCYTSSLSIAPAESVEMNFIIWEMYREGEGIKESVKATRFHCIEGKNW